MAALPQISEAEFEVMKVVWKHAPISTNEVTGILTKTTSWSPKTVQTLLKRLVTKKALTYEKQSRVFVYSPLVKEDEYISQESSIFLDRYYGGHITAMLSSYLDHDKLSGGGWQARSVPFFPGNRKKGGTDMQAFVARFLVCNIIIAVMIGVILLLRNLLNRFLSGRLQYNLWFIMLLFLAIPFLTVRSHIRLYRLKQSALPLQNPIVRRLYHNCLQEMSITKSVPVSSTAFLKSPVISGFFRPHIYLPIHLISDYDARAMRYMLLHELQHYKHKDNLANYLMNLAGVLYWFNPFVWYTLKVISQKPDMGIRIWVVIILPTGWNLP